MSEPPPFAHEFPTLELPAAHSWVAWSLNGAADRLEEVSFQVKLVRPLRGTKHATLPIEEIMDAVAIGDFGRLGPVERKRAVDELEDIAKRAPELAIEAAKGLWRSAIEYEELRRVLLRKLGGHLVGKGTIAPQLIDSFGVFAATAPGGTGELCAILERLRALQARGESPDSTSANFMRKFIIRELELEV